MAANWKWQLTDMSFNPIGEIKAKDRKISVPLNKIRTASFKLRLDDPLSTTVINNLGYLKVHRDSALMFYGPIITAQQDGEGDAGSMFVNCSGPEWIFTQRLAGRTSAGLKYAGGSPSSGNFKALLETANTEGETHIDLTQHPIEGGSTVGYEATPFKLISEVLNDFSNTIDGFDWMVYPIDNYNPAAGVTSPKIGTLTTSSDLTVVRNNAVFEWGVGANNVSKFKFIKDRSTLANRAWNISQGGPDAGPGAETVKAEDAASIAAWGLQENLVSASILNEELRKKLVDETVLVRKNPRVTISFEPMSVDNSKVPVAGIDFNTGDQIHFRTKYMPDVLMRVWGVEFNIDENGKETQTLTLSNDGA